jgi:hypothetical protein
MRHRRDPMANVVRRTWIEPIDGNAFAAIAEFTETWHGMYFAASTFLLGEIGTWAHRRLAREKAEQKLADELRRGDVFLSRNKRHGMPCVGLVKDLNRA